MNTDKSGSKQKAKKKQGKYELIETAVKAMKKALKGKKKEQLTLEERLELVELELGLYDDSNEVI